MVCASKRQVRTTSGDAEQMNGEMRSSWPRWSTRERLCTEDQSPTTSIRPTWDPSPTNVIPRELRSTLAKGMAAR